MSAGPLVVAPMREELAALRRRTGTVSPTPAVVGETAARAAAALDRLLRRHAPPALLILGVCGGLRDDLGPADLVVAERVSTPEEDAPPPDAAWLARMADGGRRGRLVSIPRVASTSEAKQALAERLGSDALAVDLETAAMAVVAARRGVPYVVLRAVSDTVHESMPAFVAACFRGDGSLSRLRVVLAANVRPERWKTLLAMRRRMLRCSRVLAEAAEAALRCAPGGGTP